MIRVLVVLIAAAVLSSCGFQLRGSGGFELGVQSVAITGGQRELIEELEDTLESIGVDIDALSPPEYTIAVLSESTTRRAVATSGNITVSEYEIRLRSLFSIVDAEGETLIPETELSAQRVYSFDAGNFGSNTEEEALLLGEMRQDLAGQLVRRFSATLRNAQKASMAESEDLDIDSGNSVDNGVGSSVDSSVDIGSDDSADMSSDDSAGTVTEQSSDEANQPDSVDLQMRPR